MTMYLETPSLPGSAGAFTLTLTDAAQVLGITPDALVDLVVGGIAYALRVPANAVNTNPPMRFAPDLLAETAEYLTNQKINQEVADMRMVARHLRVYLQERPPTDRVALATAPENAPPLIARDRANNLYAHIKADDLIAYICNKEGGFVLGSQVRAALTKLGAIQIRGVRDMVSRQQSWGTWWRLPLRFWSVSSAAMEDEQKRGILGLEIGLEEPRTPTKGVY